ncbi:FkbM family methyltransferase [Bradyrhizobium sp. JYMT SZCCT0428]|uniref:FkbM family methyltransferase n=1 Tax=Bradyrhizobium sp. JYMT SZCCT0428 TaxID=2807673 RepID=UPI001BA5B37A|nr:FkbM family methyltransferase [Bradyrhizobium sp. JYMT SZCCT0428]MBR1151581.1 FkbM family methyltransferase [Bradyrhizobium sp. JYMT SZCCT0428]
MRSVLKRLIRQTGYTISANPTFGAFLQSRAVTLVLDVGANTGQFASYLRTEGYVGEIISFEPIKSAYNLLMGRMMHDSRWSGRNIGLGEAKGTATINVSENSVFSSIVSQLDFATEFDKKRENSPD